MSDGGSLTLRDWSTGVPHTVEITAANGALTRTYFVMGMKAGMGRRGQTIPLDQCRSWCRQALAAKARVKSIYGKKV